MNDLTVGIVDFASGRALTRYVRRGGGLIRHVTNLWIPKAPAYALFDGPSLSVWDGETWSEAQPMRPTGLRIPNGLGFLDLLRREAVLDVVELGPEQLRDLRCRRYQLKLDADRIPWPEPDQRRPAQHGRLVSKFAAPPGPPKGVLPAEAWVDEPGRLVRFSYCALPKDHPNHNAVFWTTTELWDFGLPPPLTDWRTQPLLDPITSHSPDPGTK